MVLFRDRWEGLSGAEGWEGLGKIYLKNIQILYICIFTKNKYWEFQMMQTITLMDATIYLQYES